MSSKMEQNDTEVRHETEEEIEAKILHILSIYPVISPTMLQGGLGAYIKPQVWRPVLHRLIDEGKVCEAQESRQTPAGRYNSYSKLYLPANSGVVEVVEGAEG